jgi:single-strand DNA-binding protein
MGFSMINNVTLTGRMTKDAELRFTANGTPVASLTLAVNKRFKREDGPEADFINCVVWGKQAEVLADHTGKGSLIGVTGRIETRSYENSDGKKVYVTEVNVENFSFLESKREEEAPPAPAKKPYQSKYQKR